MDQPRPPNEDDVLAMFTSCSNAGRWGDDDEQGTLNHITAARRLATIRTVTEGVVYSLGRDLRLGDSNQHPSSAVHQMSDPVTGVTRRSTTWGSDRTVSRSPTSMPLHSTGSTGAFSTSEPSRRCLLRTGSGSDRSSPSARVSSHVACS